MITYIIQLSNGKTINAVGHKEKVKALKENARSRVVGKERDDSKNPPVVRPAVKPAPVAETPAEEPEEKDEEPAKKTPVKKKTTVKKKAPAKKAKGTEEKEAAPKEGSYEWYVTKDKK